MHWSDLLVPGEPLVAKIIRPIIIYVFLVIGLRLGGKRELAQLSPFDIIVLLTLSNTVQNAIIGNDNSITGGMIGAVALLAVNALVVRFLYRHEQIDKIVEGEAIVLIENGQLRPDCCERELITIAELESAAHKQGFASLQEVDRAVLEPGGTLALVGRKPDVQTMRAEEIISRLNGIQQQLAGMQQALAGRSGSA